MNVLARVSELWAGPVNGWLAGPERTIDEVLDELDHCLDEARSCTASAIAAERRLGRELHYHQSETERWLGQARTALAAGRDELGRRALARKEVHEGLIPSLQMEHAAALGIGEMLRASLRSLEIRQARVRRDLLRARHAEPVEREPPARKFARAQRQLAQWEEDLACLDVPSPAGLDHEFADFQMEQAIDWELAALKREAEAKVNPTVETKQ
jgi:phage shock protein A